MRAEPPFLPVVADTEGLICAFDLAPVAPRGLDARAEPGASPVWLHFNLSDARACRWLDGPAALPDEVTELIAEPSPRIHAQVLRGGLVAVLGDIRHDFRGDPDDFGLLIVHVDAARVLTMRSHPLRTTDQVRGQLAREGGTYATPLSFFEHLVENLAEGYRTLVADLGEETDELEERVLGGRIKDRGAALGRVRHLLARLRRQIGANRAALGPLPTRLGPEVQSEQRQTLRSAIERLDIVAQDLELVQERARLLQEEMAARIAEATNRNLYLLSIATVTLLPITLITGIFGMNVGGLPWVEHGHGFWWVMGVIGVSVLLTVGFLRSRQVL
jgi:zinc transporter